MVSLSSAIGCGYCTGGSSSRQYSFKTEIACTWFDCIAGPRFGSAADSKSPLLPPIATILWEAIGDEITTVIENLIGGLGGQFTSLVNPYDNVLFCPPKTSVIDPKVVGTPLMNAASLHGLLTTTSR